jgi:mRNA-degrading endonuclease RelE of RelBE toxin-antitoxin system
VGQGEAGARYHGVKLLLKVTQRVKNFLAHLHEKDRRIVAEHIDRLADFPEVHGDIKRLNTPKERYRMHVSFRYTIFFFPDGEDIVVNEILTTEQAHKRYGRI